MPPTVWCPSSKVFVNPTLCIDNRRAKSVYIRRRRPRAAGKRLTTIVLRAAPWCTSYLLCPECAVSTGIGFGKRSTEATRCGTVTANRVSLRERDRRRLSFSGSTCSQQFQTAMVSFCTGILSCCSPPCHHARDRNGPAAAGRNGRLGHRKRTVLPVLSLYAKSKRCGHQRQLCIRCTDARLMLATTGHRWYPRPRTR